MNREGINKESNNLYDIIKKENLFLASHLSERFGEQTLRHLIQFQNLQRKLEITNMRLPEYLGWYQENLPSMQMMPPHFTLEAITLLCYQGLGIYEHLKRFLLQTLDLEKLKKNYGVKLTAYPMLGELVNAIREIPNVNKTVLDELFDIDFRNALAHDTWYIYQSDMTYVTPKGKTETILFVDLAQKIYSVHDVASIMIKRYATDYFPEITQLYENSNRIFTGGIPPIS